MHSDGPVPGRNYNSEIVSQTLVLLSLSGVIASKISTAKKNWGRFPAVVGYFGELGCDTPFPRGSPGVEPPHICPTGVGCVWLARTGQWGCEAGIAAVPAPSPTGREIGVWGRNDLSWDARGWTESLSFLLPKSFLLYFPKLAKPKAMLYPAPFLLCLLHPTSTHPCGSAVVSAAGLKAEVQKGISSMEPAIASTSCSAEKKKDLAKWDLAPVINVLQGGNRE